MILAVERLVGDQCSATTPSVFPIRVLRFLAGLRWRRAMTLLLEHAMLEAVETRFVRCPLMEKRARAGESSQSEDPERARFPFMVSLARIEKMIREIEKSADPFTMIGLVSPI